MTVSLSECVVRIGEMSSSLEQWLRSLHQRNALLPMLKQFAREQFLLQEASALGLAVSLAELQQAADVLRRHRGLDSAQATRQWLQQQRLSAEDFEAALERDLLIEKLADHVTRDDIPRYFAAHHAELDRARLRVILVPSEDTARELLEQLREGRDFAQLARQHSQDPSASQGGDLGEVRRSRLSPTLAEKVFGSRPGEAVGPVVTPKGFCLFRVEALAAAELDADTAVMIRRELFDQWLSTRLAGEPASFPVMDALGC